ncbi:MAG: hypothetical protein ACREF4_16975, partial [Gammaproteobacteria bacterium]
MTNVFVTITGTLFGVPTELRVQVAGGPLSISWAPRESIPLTGIWTAMSDELHSLVGVGLPDITSGLWADLLKIDPSTTVQPTLWFTASKDKSSGFSIYLELALSEPITIGGHAGVGGLSVTLSPNIQIWSLYVGYTEGSGIDLRARISIPTAPAPKLLAAGATTPDKFEIVTYPFPVPSQSSVGVFQLKYLGLGQRVG